MTGLSTWFLHKTSAVEEGRVPPALQGLLLAPYQVVVSGLHVGHGGKAGQALLVHEDPKRVAGCDQDIDSHIELEAVNEEGLSARKSTRENNNAVKCFLCTTHCPKCFKYLITPSVSTVTM